MSDELREDRTPLPGKPWLVRLTCCGRADGVYAALTWEEADRFRLSYTAPGHYEDVSGLGGGHRRSAVIEDGYAPALAARPDSPTLDVALDRALAVPHRDDDQPCSCDECMAYGAEDSGADWYRIPPANRVAIRILDGADDRLAAIAKAFRDHDEDVSPTLDVEPDWGATLHDNGFTWDDVNAALAIFDHYGYVVRLAASPAPTLFRTIEAYEAVVEAARNYSPERDHDWRCEYRTAEVGWQPGDPPVIRCECGYDELQTALAALDTAKEAGR